jgi:electron transfer flavoprotein alpha subunit
MSVLVVAEHDNESLDTSTLHTITAARELSDDVHLLVAGAGCAGVAEGAARIAGVAKVRCADDARYGHGIAEPLAALMVSLSGDYSHLLVPATRFGKNVLPRAAALLDVSSISDITEIQGEDTFVRPIYAGNAIATVKSSDAIKLLSVRATAFEAAETEGGSAAVETVEAADDPGIARFVSSPRPGSSSPAGAACRTVRTSRFSRASPTS